MKALLLNICLLLALLSPVASLFCETCMAVEVECSPDSTTIELCTGYDDVCVTGQVYVAMIGGNSYEEGNEYGNGQDYENRNNPYDGGYGDDYDHRNNVHRREYGGDYGHDYGNRNNTYGEDYGNENFAIITTYKGCMSRKKCHAGFFSMLTEGNRVIQQVRRCCESNNCNGAPIEMENPNMFSPNGLLCPSCFSTDLSECEIENYIQCTGRMTQCVDFMARTTTLGLITTDISLRGCATESVCSSSIGRIEIGGSMLVYDIYKTICSLPLIYPNESGRGSTGGGSSYGDDGRSSYKPGRSSSYGNDGRSSYGDEAHSYEHGGTSSYGDGSSSYGDGSSSYQHGGSSSYGDGSSSYGDGSSSYGRGGRSSYGDGSSYERGGSSSYGDGSSSYEHGGRSSYGGGSSSYGDGSPSYEHGGRSSYGDDGSSSYEHGRSSSYEDNGGFSNERSRSSSYAPDVKKSM